MKVYLDNAATTPLDPKVYEAMEPLLKDHYGNPSSIHSYGREVRSAIEQARKTVAEILNASPGEIFFTSSGTESDNTFLINAIKKYQIKHVVTSPIEHHAVLHPLEELEKQNLINVHFINMDKKGGLDLEHLENLLKTFPGSLVSVMHVNNEIGNVNDIESIGEMCNAHNAVFHSDTVQSLGHFKHNLKETKVHSICGSAHKLHGPKGIGMMYIKKGHTIPPYILGGGQERNMRAGTENVYGIVGFAKALEIAHENRDENTRKIKKLKQEMIRILKENVPSVSFNGYSGILDKSIHTILNVSLPHSPANDMVLFNLDLKGVSASGGSACTSGSNVGSHVLSTLNSDPSRGAVRFSFSRFNTKDEIHFTANALTSILNYSQKDKISIDSKT